MRYLSNHDRKPAGHASGTLRNQMGSKAPASTSPARLRRLLAVAFTMGVLAAGADAAQAQVHVDGRPDAVHIEAHDVSLQEVLAALQAKFNLSYRTDGALETRKTGTFNGTLPQVAARILDGYDFAMKITPQGIDVLVLRQNRRHGNAVAAELPIRATLKRSSAPAMSAAEANRYEREHYR